MNHRSILSTIDVFKGVPPAHLAKIEKRATEKRYAKGESLFLEGDPAESVWFVKEGHVKSVSHSANGKDQTLCMIGSNGLFGTCCCFDGGTYACNSVAETDAVVMAIPFKDFLELMDQYPSVSMAVVGQLSKRLRQSKDMRTFEQESVEKRILHVLINLVEEFGETIPLTRREIAEMVGTTVETSIRTFSKLEEDKLVSTARGRIVVRDLNALSARMEKA